MAASPEPEPEPEPIMSDGDSDTDPLTSLLPEEAQYGVVPGSGAPHLIEHHRVKSLTSDILIRQLPSEGLSFQLWPAATTLLTLLDDPTHPLTLTLLRRRRRLRILELGSGTGLVGIAAAAILGADVTLTDLPHVIGNLQYNAEANAEVVGNRGGVVRVNELSWGNVGHMESVGREYDLILGSDVVYHDHLYEPLLETLKWFMLLGDDAGMKFVMAHLKRWKKETAFFKKANKLFDVDVVHRDPPADGKRVGVLVYRFAVKKNKPRGLGSGSGSYVGSPEVKDSGVGS